MKLENNIKNTWKMIRKNSLALALALPLVFGSVNKAFAGKWGSGYDYTDYSTPTYDYSFTNPPTDFEDYINDRKYDIDKVLIMGIGRIDEPIKYKDYFTMIIPLSHVGNASIDLGKAILEHFNVPISSTDFEALKGKRINELYVHSWSADAAVNQIRLNNIKVDNLILIDPPGAYRDLDLPNTKVDVYVGRESAFRFIPEIRTWQSSSGEKIPGVGYTFKFGSGGNNIHLIDTNHSLESHLDHIINQSQIPKVESFRPNIDTYKPQTLPSYNLKDSYGPLALPQITIPTLRYDPPKVDFNTYRSLYSPYYRSLTIPQTTMPTFQYVSPPTYTLPRINQR